MEQNGLVEERHSVTWKINAKSQLSGECKCYGITPEDALAKASSVLKVMEEVIKQKNGLMEE